MNRATRRGLRWLLAALVLGAVFAAYLNPEMAVDLASRVWACF
jgi:glycerol uptake facilitator-like aquaporin